MISFLTKKRITRILSALLALLVLFFSYRLISENNQFNVFKNQEQVYTEKVDEIIVEDIPTKKDLSIIFGGDIMLSRTVNAKMLNYNDYAWPARLIASTTASADIAVFNLESPFLKNSNYSVPTGSFSFKANPLAIETLNFLGADILSLANNHMLNAGKQGLIDTIAILEDNQIASVGAGLDEEAARKGFILETDGWKVAFLSYAYPEDNSVATEARAGIATMNLENLKLDIERLKKQSDLVIILMHSGVEYRSQAGLEQIVFAHAAIDYGADAVIGHHPHWPQNWEVYKDRPIFYSLGNFIFDQMWSQATSQGLLAELVFHNDSSGSAKLVPIIIKDYGQVDLWPVDKDESNFWSTYNLEKPEQINW